VLSLIRNSITYKERRGGIAAKRLIFRDISLRIGEKVPPLRDGLVTGEFGVRNRTLPRQRNRRARECSRNVSGRDCEQQNAGRRVHTL
jgi:hypothetical protein